ncbi:UTP--glucose-1-phosphate uridylyltransferase [Nibricoccus aquaticus]|uniref:UTP--glucose-1-phosphate uridylyltransferase n=1 Tax=Nibricoccus aquaticus TaxID=2576891 RepID=A0A290QFP2_9BACT|nr:UTP--glucose-1-phosphate uridylyltransferase [Nibricoccus aquaticus]ATC63171.1 UTP--glucose-1-phosphate uridylyltransferase [Nibricoccus aquaticus]
MDATLLALVEGADSGANYFEKLCRAATRPALEAMAEALEAYRQRAGNFYHRVRAIFFLEALHRYFLPPHYAADASGTIPFAGHKHCLARRYEEAVGVFLAHQKAHGTSDALSSALSAAYHGLAFKTLAQQVQKTVRTVRGNQWMFRMGHPLDYPLKLRRELLERATSEDPMPVLFEETAVRMDLSHAAWSDIFFLGMDYPDGAKVLNISVNLGVHGRDAETRPPVCAFLRVIDEPVLRLTSVDLGATTDVKTLDEVFDFAKDYLGLLKAAVIAAGVIPSGLEGSGQALSEILSKLVGPGRGLEIASQVRDIPKGSRLAVSTNLLGCLIALCMRATGQTASLTGALSEAERRTILSRAILGEWLGGSGGGWQDSGGVWPGIKLIEGMAAESGDSEYGTSRGRLLPKHTVLGTDAITARTRKELQDSLILVHGGMSQNVGPILEMVTEKYLLKLEKEWNARIEAQQILRGIVDALKSGDVARVAQLTTENFFGPIQTIIPWASNAYTERLIAEARAALGAKFRGFVMLGGMSGGGMGFFVDPAVKAQARATLLEIMTRTKRALESALPFAMDPVVYDFEINENGSYATLRNAGAAMFSPEYYLMMVPRWLRQDPRTLRPEIRREMDRFSATSLYAGGERSLLAPMMQRIFPAQTERRKDGTSGAKTVRELLAENGFDSVQHERIRDELRAGRIGLAQNRLPATAVVEDVAAGDVVPIYARDEAAEKAGLEALREGRVAVVTLAAGAGSRWTQGAGTVKALHPFAKLGGRHRSFIETHLAKSAATGKLSGAPVTHIFTTSYLTHGATEAVLSAEKNFRYGGRVMLSAGRSIGLRMVPTARDLRFAFEEMPHQQLDPQKEKVRASLHKALIDWAVNAGEASDYTDNLPGQCLHPVGHWYEVANLLLNGTLRELLAKQPQVEHLMLHNIDTLGANLDPVVFGKHILEGAAISVEVIRRRLEDRGGGLARVNGQLRLVEGLAMAREEDEFALTYYNSATNWIHVDSLLELFGVTRETIGDAAKVAAGVRALAAKMPSYVTLKDVKKRWGNGQEDIMPVAQFEKLWGDMTTLHDAEIRFFAVPRARGQQLKDQAQLDGWLRDGSAAGIERLCVFG